MLLRKWISSSLLVSKNVHIYMQPSSPLIQYLAKGAGHVCAQQSFSCLPGRVLPAAKGLNPLSPLSSLPLTAEYPHTFSPLPPAPLFPLPLQQVLSFPHGCRNKKGWSRTSLTITYRSGLMEPTPVAIRSAFIISGHPGILTETILA